MNLKTQENIDIFDIEPVYVKPGKNEIIYCTAPYAAEFYQMLSFDNGESLPKLKIGQIQEGVIVKITDKTVYVDIKHKDYVVCPKSKESEAILTELQEGSEIDVTITAYTDKPNFYIEGNISASYEVNIKEYINELIERQEAVEAHVKEWITAGYYLVIDINGLKINAFMPNTIAGVNKLANPEELVNKRINVILESFSDENGTFIASRKRYLESLIPTAITQLVIGDYEYIGEVTGTTPFGIFIEFNDCLTGMIHETNLDPEWLQRLKNGGVQPKMKIPFKIKEIIKTKLILTQVNKYSIWDDIKIGQKYTGKVFSIKPFGTIIQLDQETKGLIHENELAKFKGYKPALNESVEVKVISFDRLNRKIFFVPIV